MSEISRIIGVFVGPKQAFADIVARPRWYVPVILSSIAGLIFTVALSQRIGFDRIVQQSIDQNPRMQSMPPEQRANAVKTGETVGKAMAYVGAITGPAIGVVLVGAVLMFIANSMLGSRLEFGQMAAITAYSFLTGLVTVTLTILVMYIRSPDDFDIKNPLAFNLGAFLNVDSTPKWLMSLATSLDIFSFWTMALLAIGLTVATKRLGFTKAFVAVMIPWAIFVLGKAALAGIFS
jgi:hypothetical protein